MNEPQLEPHNLLGEGKRFTILLVALLIMFLVLPLFSGQKGVFAFMNDLVFTLLMIAAVYSLCENRKFLFYAWLLGLPAVLLRWSFWAYPEPFLWKGSYLFAIALLLFSAYKLLSFLMRVTKVGQETINAAICVYLSLGVAWAMAYVLLELLLPGAFRIAEYAKDSQIMVLEMVYYSMVTLTTLGYGDITPVTPLAKNLSALEAIIGQVYLTVLVARLVSLNIAQANEDEK